MSHGRLLMSGQMSVGPDIGSIEQTLKVSIEHWCDMVTQIQMEKWLALHGWMSQKKRPNSCYKRTYIH